MGTNTDDEDFGGWLWSYPRPGPMPRRAHDRLIALHQATNIYGFAGSQNAATTAVIAHCSQLLTAVATHRQR